MKNVGLFLLLLLMTTASHAKSIKGEIKIIDNHFMILLEGKTSPYFIQASNPTIAQTLMALNEGDYIEAEGKDNFDSRIATISAIKHLGLIYLRGTWETSEGEIFSFSKDSISYNPSANLEANSFNQASTFKYIINQSIGYLMWNFLYMESASSGLGEIRIYEQFVDLYFYSQSGGTVERVSRLYPVNTMAPYDI